MTKPFNEYIQIEMTRRDFTFLELTKSTGIPLNQLKNYANGTATPEVEHARRLIQVFESTRPQPKHYLVGCIDQLENTIKTRYLYVNAETRETKDVTYPLFTAVQKYNTAARKQQARIEHALIIPYDYYNGLVEYSFGCGLSHYLQPDLFPALAGEVDFPLAECRFRMYTPLDIRDILGVTGVFDARIGDAILNRL